MVSAFNRRAQERQRKPKGDDESTTGAHTDRARVATRPPRSRYTERPTASTATAKVAAAAAAAVVCVRRSYAARLRTVGGERRARRRPKPPAVPLLPPRPHTCTPHRLPVRSNKRTATRRSSSKQCPPARPSVRQSVSVRTRCVVCARSSRSFVSPFVCVCVSAAVYFCLFGFGFVRFPTTNAPPQGGSKVFFSLHKRP